MTTLAIRSLDALVVGTGYWALAVLFTAPLFVLAVGLIATAKVARQLVRMVR